MHSDIYESICFKLGMMIDTSELNILILVCDLDFDSRSQGSEKSNLQYWLTYSLQWIWMEFVLLLRLDVLINVVVILPCPICIHGKDSNLGDFRKKKKRPPPPKKKKKKKKTPPATTKTKQSKKIQKALHFCLALKYLLTKFFQTWYGDRHH